MSVSNQKKFLLEVLDEAMQADHASFGNVQLYNDSRGGLEIVASRGFEREFLELFDVVSPDCPSACGRALRLGQRVQVRDITADPYFGPFLEVARRAGFRSVQSTPIESNGRILGVISTHFRSPHVLSSTASERLDSCAVKAARLIETGAGNPV